MEAEMTSRKEVHALRAQQKLKVSEKCDNLQRRIYISSVLTLSIKLPVFSKRMYFCVLSESHIVFCLSCFRRVCTKLLSMYTGKENIFCGCSCRTKIEQQQQRRCQR